MKEMSSRHPEVRQLLASLTGLITRACNVRSDTTSNDDTKLCFQAGLLEARAVGTCLLGLKVRGSSGVWTRICLAICFCIY